MGLQAGLVAVGAASVALAAGLGASIASAAKFEQTMSGVKAVSGATGAELKQLSDKALQLGKDTSFSASQAASGLEELVKGGVSIADIMAGAADATLNLAAAGGVDLARAAEIASNALNQFNLTGADMGHVADLIAGAANASSLEVGDFALSLQQVGAVANATGQTFDSTAEAIAIMGAAGIKGSDAGTSLKTMLLGLQPSTKGATAALRELGIITADGTNLFLNANGTYRSMAEISGILKTATQGLTEAERIATLQTIFGTDAVRAAAVMAKTGAEGFDAMAESMGKVSAAEVAATRLDNLAGSVEQLRGSFETATIAIGEVFLPIVREGMDKVTDAINQALPHLQTWQERMGEAFATGGFDAWLAELGKVGGEIGRAVADWGPRFAEFIQPARDTLGTALNEVWTGTVEPWIHEQGDRVGTEFTYVWAPAMSDWIEETAIPRVQGELALFARAFLAWVESDGARAMDRAAGSLVSAFVHGFTHLGIDLHNEIVNQIKSATVGLPEIVQQAIAAVFVNTTPRTGGSVGGSFGSPTGGANLGGGDLRAIAAAAAQQYGVDPRIFLAQINQESGFNPSSRSGAGAQGIAQFMPGTGAGIARQLGVPESTFWAQPELQLQGAALHMSDLLRMFGGDYQRALAGYNAGAGAVQQYGGVPPYGETESYVRSILAAAGTSAATPGSSLAITSGPSAPGARRTPPPPALDPNTVGGEAQVRATRERAKQAGEEAAASFGDGFMGELQKSTATFEAFFGEKGGKVASALADTLAKEIPDPSSEAAVARAMESLITAAREAGLPEWRESGDQLAGAILTAVTERTPEARAAAMDMIAQMAEALKHVSAFTPESLANSLGLAGLETEMGGRGTAIVRAFATAAEKGTPETVAALAGSVEQMRVALLADDHLDPADAQAKFASVLEAVDTAIADGSPAALSELRSFLADFNRELETSKISENAARLANVAIENAQVQITALYDAAEQRKKDLYTNLAIAQWDRGQQELLSTWTQNYLDDTKQRIDALHQERQELRASEAAQRQEIKETADLEKRYQDERAALLKKQEETATSSAGRMGQAAMATAQAQGFRTGPVTEPGADIAKQIKELDTQHVKDQAELATNQATRRQERIDRKADQVADLAYYKTLDDTVWKPAQASANAIDQQWRDNYTLMVTIPREVNTMNDKTASDVEKINAGLTTALEKYNTDADAALARLNLMHTETFPLLKQDADSALTIYREAAEAALSAIEQGQAILSGHPLEGGDRGGEAPTPYTTGMVGASGQGYAKGGTTIASGWAMVGEQGPELVNLPGGSRVYPNGTSMIDYDKLAAALAKQPVVIQMDRQPVGRLIRTDQRYYDRANLTNGVGGL